MKKGKLYFIFFAGFISIVILASAFMFYTNKVNSDKKYSRLEHAEPDKPKNSSESKSSEAEKPEDLYSSPVTSAPWENDGSFKRKQAESNTPVLMAAYRTVLRDPLPGEEYNVHLAAQMLAGTLVKPGETFSQNDSIGPYTEARGFKAGPAYIGFNLSTSVGGGVCKIASTLYNVAVLSNLDIVERHAHGMPVPYVPYGQDATVSYGAQDFKFKNATDSPVLIWAQGVDNILYMGFYGKSKPPKIEWRHETFEAKKASNVYKKNPSLPAGTEKKVSDGMDGASVKSWIILEWPDGVRETRQMGKSVYAPMPNVFEANR